MKKNKFIFLGFFVILGLILRFIYLDHITFGYDQARDAFAALDIWHGDPIKIIGPTTDIKGLFHGPLYWYLISPFYYFFNQNPIAVRVFLILTNITGIFILFFIALKLFQNVTIAYISAFIFAVSYEAVGYSRWLSNPSFALLTIPFFFYGFWLTLNKKNSGFSLIVCMWALSVQFQFFLAYLAILIIVAFVRLYGKNIKRLFAVTKKDIFFYALSLFFLSSFVMAEFQFKFQGMKAFLNFFTQHTDDPVFKLKIMRFIQSLTEVIGNTINSQFKPLSIIILVFLTGYMIYGLVVNKKNKKEILFLYLWFISPYLIYPFERNNSYFLNIGNIYPLILLTSIIIYEFSIHFKKLKYLIIATILFFIFMGNIKLILTNNKNGDVLFSVQKNMHLVDEKKVLDYLYTENNKKEFYVNTVTNPLFTNTTWSYLFDWYGKSMYGYMPIWYGYPQDGTYGEHVVYNKLTNQINKTLYLIIEPSIGIPLEYISGYITFENLRSKKISEKKFGKFIVEKRVLKNNRYFSLEELFEIVKPSAQ